MVSDSVSVFGLEVADRLTRVLGERFVGTYFVGSIALGGYVAGESDIDIVAVCSHPLDHAAKCSVVEAVEMAVTSCPARGLEFTLYHSEVARSGSGGAGFEVNVNGGPRMERVVRLDPTGEPGFWYFIDRGIARRFGVTILGPPPADLFAPVERPALTEAMVESMRWHRDHEKATLYSVLNAARAWRLRCRGRAGLQARRRGMGPETLAPSVGHGRGR